MRHDLRLSQDPYACGWIRPHTRVYGSWCCGAMAGDVNRAARCQTWKCTTKSFAAMAVMIPRRTSSRSALHVTHPFMDGQDDSFTVASVLSLKSALLLY